MATYVNDLRLKEITTGDESGTWGTSTNTNLELIAEAFSYGTEAITTNADTHTTTIADGSTDPGRSLYLKYTGTLDSACTITIGPDTVSKVWIIENGTSGSQNIIISQGSGADITIPAGDTKVVYSDGAGAGAAFFDAFASLNVGALNVDGAVNFAADVTFADGADIITASAGTSNFRAGVNAGNSIESGGNYNVVVGDEAGTAITTGDNNVAVGYDALSTNNTGSENTAVGLQSLQSNTTASNNTAIGRSSMQSNTTGNSNVSVGMYSLYSNSTASNNTAVGYSALLANTEGSDNVAIGYTTLDANTTGIHNVAVGNYALTANTTGQLNTAIGHESMFTSTTGSSCVGVGRRTLYSNTTASNNTALGYLSLYLNTEGSENTGVGGSSMQNTTTGGGNAAVGYGALAANTTGATGVAVGAYSLHANTTADSNVAVGYFASRYNTTGANNTAVGYYALAANTTASGNTAVGRAAHGVATWATVSDERYKKDIVDSTAGLSFINALQPRTFKYKTLGELPETFSAYEEGSTKVFKNANTNHGFIAQEVKAAIDADDSIKDGFKLWDDREDGSQEVAETALIPVLVKALQELSAEVETLKSQIGE
jgi:hypothetical protein